jgi:hypothetical protein
MQNAMAPRTYAMKYLDIASRKKERKKKKLLQYYISGPVTREQKEEKKDGRDCESEQVLYQKKQHHGMHKEDD